MIKLIHEYEQILIGRRQAFSHEMFHYGPAGNERQALAVIRYAAEYLLGWSPEQSSVFFTYPLMKYMHLDPLMKYIRFPSGLTPEDTDYIFYLLYPSKVPYDFTRHVIQIYERVLDSDERYPKHFLYGAKGIARANICLRYALQKNKVFHSLKDAYHSFAAKDGIQFLKDNKLYDMCHYFFDSPLEYFHNCMDTEKSALYYNYYYLMGKLHASCNSDNDLKRILDICGAEI